MNFIIRWLVTAVAVGVAVWLVPGIDLIGGTSAWAGIALFALILSLVNISIRPIMQVLSLPVTVLTLGIFYLVVNTLMLYIAAWLANGIFQVGFDIVSFGSAFVASIVISIVSSLMNALVGKDVEALRARKPEGLRRCAAQAFVVVAGELSGEAGTTAAQVGAVSQRGRPWRSRSWGSRGRRVLGYASPRDRREVGRHGLPQRRQVPAAGKPPER